MATPLRFGLFSINMDACIEPGATARIAKLAEEAGFDSLWGGEHIVLPDPRSPDSGMDPDDPILDPLISLTFAAALTSTIKLGTGIIILPQRNPLVLAKQIASLDALSGGRFIFGIGIGYLEPEFRALGVPFDHKAAGTDEYLAAMRAIWQRPQPAYDGHFVSFAGVQAYPRPRHIPVVVGGHSPGAYRRTVEQADGWYGFGLTLEETAECLVGLRTAAARYARPAELGDLEISVTPPDLPDRDTAARYAELGVQRLILMPPRRIDEAQQTAFATHAAETLIGRV